MKAAKIYGLALIGTMFGFDVAAMPDYGMADALYNYARAGNEEALARMKRSGYSLDTTDAQGNTPLCKALIKKDSYAYNLLRKAGADVTHPCVKRLEAAIKPVKSNFLAWNIGPTTYVGAAALIGGTVAIAASSSGGSDDDENGGEKPGGGDNPGGGDGPEGGPGGDTGDDTEGLQKPEFFETDEYKAGGFLSQIGASEAYSKFYKLDENNNLVSKLAKVEVGVVDSGVYGGNFEFSGKDVQGFNYDYGPCSKSGNSTNCWEWKSEYSDEQGRRYENVVVLTLESGEVYITRIGENGTKEEYDQWASQYKNGYDWNEASQEDNPFYPGEGNGDWHGTHVAGIIAANKDENGMHGVAFENAQLRVVRWDLMSSFEDPVRELIDTGAEVINFSLGIDSTPDLNASTIAENINLLKNGDYLDAFRYQAETSNVVFVFSAGNESQDNPGILNGIPLLDEFKDSLKNLFVTVVSVDSNNNISDFSNRCGAAQNYCIAAPGENIVSTLPGEDSYGSSDGTSMAAPVVTGSIAFLMGAYEYMSSQEIVQLIFETATDLGDPGVDAIYGHGLINLAEAVKPQGEQQIPETNSVDGKSVSFRATSMSVPAVFRSAMLKRMPSAVVTLDKYKRPYAMPMTSIVSATHSGDRNFKNDLFAFSRYQPKKTVQASEGLSFAYAPAALKTSANGLGLMQVEFKDEKNVTGFYYTENTSYNHDSFYEKTLSNPFLAMNSAYGFYNRYSPSSDWDVSMGFSVGENGLYDGSLDEHDRDFDNQAYGFDSSVSYRLSKNVSFGVISGMLYEDSAMLGLNGTGGFDVSDSSTYFAGVSVNWQPMRNLYLSGVYYQGITDAGNMASNLIQTGSLRSDSFALDAHYMYNKTDVVGFQVSSPLRIYRGTAKFDLPVGRDNKTDTVYRERYSASLKPDAREYKFSLYHDRSINEDMSFKTQFDMRLNPEHQKDAETDYRVMFGFSWTFN